MQYRDLRDFIAQLERTGELKRIHQPVDPYLEITEVCDRVLRVGGPALLFEQAGAQGIPLLANLFGTEKRVAMGMGRESAAELREIGKLLAYLKQPQPPKGFKALLQAWPVLKKVMQMSVKTLQHAPCQEIVLEGPDVDLNLLPVQTCWPEDAGPLITWGLTVTAGPRQARLNLGIYRQQVIAPNKIIMRWLAHRGGALDFQDWQQHAPGQPFPVAVVLGADPATLLAAVTPVPDSLSEYAFAGLLRGERSQVVKCLDNDLLVPAGAEFILEGVIQPGETALEGPFGDHTGYYNEAEHFPVMQVQKITHRRQPIYLSTYTGKPPDEPAVLGAALNEVFIPLLQTQFPEIVDFYLPPEGCSYRLAAVSLRKQYPGHAKRMMLGIWSFLRQFMYTKFIIVVDEDIDVRNWKEVIWAITTRMDPQRDSVIIDNTPIDYLDFASPVSGLGSKIGLDATHKWPAETARVWGRSIQKSVQVQARIDAMWKTLGLE